MFKGIEEDDFYRFQDNLDPERQHGAIIKKRLEELRGEQVAGFYRADKRVTVVDTKSTTSGDSLEQDNCTHCHSTYGHTIKCPTLNAEAAAELKSVDDFFLKSLRISIN